MFSVLTRVLATRLLNKHLQTARTRAVRKVSSHRPSLVTVTMAGFCPDGSRIYSFAFWNPQPLVLTNEDDDGTEMKWGSVCQMQVTCSVN